MLPGGRCPPHTPFSLPRGLPLPRTPRSGGRACGGPISRWFFLKFLELFGGSTGPGKYLNFFLVKFHVGCTQNHVWGPPGPRVMSIFVKTYICARDVLGETHGWKERQKLYRMVFSKYKTLDCLSTLWAYLCDIILWHYDSLIIYVTYCTILYFVVLYYTLLYYIVLYYIILLYNVLKGIIVC